MTVPAPETSSTMASFSTLLADLSSHLRKVDEEPNTRLNADLLDQCKVAINTPEYRDKIWTETRPLFLQIATLLPNLQQDPSPLTDFLLKLAEPYRFDDVKDIEFETGLDLKATPYHRLILTLLSKAGRSSVDAQVLANRPTVMAAVVRLWLCTGDAGIATQAEDLLVSLLHASTNEPVSIATGADAPLQKYGKGPVWRRLFSDQDIASLYYQYTALKRLASWRIDSIKYDRTYAQARLLSWLPRVGEMDFASITSSYGLHVERIVGLAEGQGLLHYATLKMVDVENDSLMHLTLIFSLSALITTVKTKPHLTHYDSSLALDFLKNEGIHQSLIDTYLTDGHDPEHERLSLRTAQYISDWALNYPENFEKSPETPKIRDHVHRNIRRCEAKNLNIIASMPRRALIPLVDGTYVWYDCILLDLPITVTNADAIKTLATVLRGPPKEEITFPQVEVVGSDPTRHQTEAFFARLLTALFYSKKPNMFADMVNHMETVALKDNALAALGFIKDLVTASWSSESLPEGLPSNDNTLSRLSEFPKSGVDIILEPTISGGVLPSLLKPATSFSNLVGGRGDAEDAAYQVAMAKFEVLKALGRKLEEDGGRQDVLDMVRRRVAQGPWGQSGSVGSRIGTLEL